jgi:hypothetical protein
VKSAAINRSHLSPSLVFKGFGRISPSAVSENVFVAGSAGAGHASSADNSNLGIIERDGFFRLPRKGTATPGIRRAAHSASGVFKCFKREGDTVQTSSNW